MTTERKVHEGYVDGTEQFVAAVWYVMKEAQREYETNKRRILKGRLPRWYFLTRVRKALELPSQQVNYGIMRQELLAFANNFGVEGHHSPDAPFNPRNAQAAADFAGADKE